VKGADPRVAQAEAARAAGRLAEAADLYRHITRDRPRDAHAHHMLGQVLHQLGELGEARRVIDKAAKLDPRNAEVHLTHARVLHAAGEGDGALTSFERARHMNPRLVLAHCGVATVHEQSGDLDKALAAVEQALGAERSHPYARVMRARLHRRAGELEPALAELDELVGEGLGVGQMFRVLFERARVLERLKRYDEAFETYAQANRVQSQTPPARAVHPDHIFALVSAFGTVGPAEWLDDPPADDGPAPAFLVGFDRSGTTMTEQILGAHPAVATTDERPLVHEAIRAMVAMFPRGTPFPTMLAALDRPQLAELRAAYRAAAERLWPKGKTLVDKFPLNILNAAFINRLFPESRMLVCLRDPRDVCLSCFFQEFAPNPATVNFFDLARTVALFNAVMGLYTEQRAWLTLPRLELRYERTVSEFEPACREMLDFLGLAWDDRVLNFHDPSKTGAPRRFVSTPSHEGVTSPVNTRAVGRWRRYGQRAELEGVGKVAEKLGYSGETR